MKLKTICFALALSACTPTKISQPTESKALTPTLAAQSTFRVNIKAYDDDANDWVQVSSGTAWIAFNGSASSLLVTAGHVCEGDEFRYTLTSSAGTEYGVYELKKHSTYDLCLMVADEVLGPEMPFADSMPTYDEPVLAVGAPLGVYGCWAGSSIDACGMAPISRGFFAGGNLVSMPMYGGNSGSAVFTADGVFGVLVEGYRQFPMLSFVEPLDHLKDFLN